jgi:hypothetical protein
VVWGIVLFDRVGSVADERDLHGDERIVSERGQPPQVPEIRAQASPFDQRA